ncbi:LDL receptor repeat-containing protein egg-1-like [Branchiostoma lanceolatum]|uniref:LDL receptor repeat-containing protein egg-1-like n=1 Tax=Branchiostoma lanceolatum TaxID=7740 RepID=UPI0034538F5A
MDGSDEENCDQDDLCTSIGYWTCKSRVPPYPKCIKQQDRCNGAVDCRDFSDEIGCDYCGHDAMAGFNIINFWDSNIVTQGEDSSGLYQDGCIPLDYVCDGIDDWYSQDETNCAQGLTDQCPEWQCPGENTCVSRYKRCDTVIDCANGEDENRCDEYCKAVGGFDCGANVCIEQHLVCDGHPDCDFRIFSGAPADEQGCGSCVGFWTAMAMEMELLGISDYYNHTCSSGKCAGSYDLCDDVDTCGNWEDEQDCVSVDCHVAQCEATHKCLTLKDPFCSGIPECLDSTDELKCGLTKCMDTMIGLDIHKEISTAQYCDGKADCRSGADESPAKCGKYRLD